ncbi:MAG: hypothetical protein ACP5PA_00890, partial [Elusimicrobiales bacterium]
MAVYYPKQKDDKKKGFLPFFSRMFGSASRTAEGLGAGGIGKAGFFASLFSTKTGVIGLLLGAATIAAGIGLIYNYIGPSSGKIYTPALFSDAYYQEAQKQANTERASSDVIPPEESTLAKFAEAARKDLSVESNEAQNTQPNDSSSDQSSPNPSVQTQEVNPSNNIQGQTSGGKLQAQLGFNNASGGASSSSGARLQTSGGLWSTMGKQFSPLGGSTSKLQASGKTGKMNKALTARLIASPKYHVPNINKKGAFGQAKFSGNVGKSAAFSPSDTGARTTAEQAFSGQTAGSGDIAVPIGGTGLGGAGLSNGGKLKANDPSLNVNEYTPPTPQKTKDTPWEKLMNSILDKLIITAGLYLVFKILSNITKPPFSVGMRVVLLALAAAIITNAVLIIKDSFELMSKYGQKMMGL